MAVQIFGGVTIQPLEVNFSASQHQTTLIFGSNNSGSYIYSGSDPVIGIQRGYLTFEDSGSLYSVVFSGSGYGSPSSLPGTVISASINGLTTSSSIANAFTASIVSKTNMTASIVSGNIVILTNSAYSSSIYTTSSFFPSTISLFNSQQGHRAGYMSGSDTTGSLQLTGSMNISGSFRSNVVIIPSSSMPTSSFGEAGQILLAYSASIPQIYINIGGKWASASLST
jgi:hypothetical protein